MESKEEGKHAFILTYQVNKQTLSIIPDSKENYKNLKKWPITVHAIAQI